MFIVIYDCYEKSYLKFNKVELINLRKKVIQNKSDLSNLIM